jgi:hypothetical protein
MITPKDLMLDVVRVTLENQKSFLRVVVPIVIIGLIIKRIGGSK